MTTIPDLTAPANAPHEHLGRRGQRQEDRNRHRVRTADMPEGQVYMNRKQRRAEDAAKRKGAKR